ncbi:hypothetical protein ABZ897_09350 [Nonomuraea sp. NPDC046802]|uniref:hypothetical protein n=1 Tax=Nonomuraea sp. NPDC046802 TaxID=3154919 RepID=UPI0034100DE7
MGLSAPFAGGLGVVALGSWLVIRPSRAKWEQARLRPLPAAWTDLAHAHDLGEERARYWGPGSVSQGVVVYERGFILGWSGETTAHRWDEAAAVYERTFRKGRKVLREYVLLWSGSEEWLTLTDEHIEDLAGLGKVFVGRVSESLRPKVAAALERGEGYLFPGWGQARHRIHRGGRRRRRRRDPLAGAGRGRRPGRPHRDERRGRAGAGALVG